MKARRDLKPEAGVRFGGLTAVEGSCSTSTGGVGAGREGVMRVCETSPPAQQRSPPQFPAVHDGADDAVSIQLWHKWHLLRVIDW